MSGRLFDDSEAGLPLGGALGLRSDDLVFFPGFLPESELLALFESLYRDTPWRQERIRLFGEEHPLPRLTAWHGDPGAGYVYSGLLQQPHAWTVSLAALRDRVTDQAGHRFDSVLLNLYRDGADTVAWHADDEPELGSAPVIASVSLGATRRFRIRRRDDHARCIDLQLGAGSLLIMRGPLQQLCEHTVPRTARPVGPRINLTFRRVCLVQTLQLFPAASA
jgi:alkylated DNA repair dioxygenase AlkB